MSFDFKIVNQDLSLKDGQLQTVTDEQKLVQDILKICLTPIGVNPFFTAYGSYLSAALIGNPSNDKMIVDIAKNQLTSCLNNLKSLQASQINSYQRLSADEQLAAISSIDIYRNPNDYRVYTIDIKCITKGLKKLNASFYLNQI
jgi:hypothetical protein